MRRTVPLVVLVILAGAVPAFSQPPLSLPLTQEQVACEQAQLRRLIRRMVSDFQELELYLWRSSPGGGYYSGLIISPIAVRQRLEQFERRETQMSFDLLLDAAADRLDPSRPLLPHAQLIRRDAATNPYQGFAGLPFYPFPLDVHLDIAPVVSNAFERTLSLDLTNLPGEDRVERSGRGIVTDDLASACHSEVTSFDQSVFTILSRSLRLSPCLQPPFFGCLGNTATLKAVFFRAPQPRHYWVEVHNYGLACSPPDSENCIYVSGPYMVVELAFETDPEGRLSTGTARVLPLCDEGQTFGCSSLECPPGGVFILPPLTPGRDTQDQSAFDRGVYLRCDHIDPANSLFSATIDWADLLRDTAWNSPP